MSKEFAPIFSDFYLYKLKLINEQANNLVNALDKNMRKKDKIKAIAKIEKDYLERIKNIKSDAANIQS